LPRSLTLADLQRGIAIQASAFQDDPFWAYLVPDPIRRKTLLRQVFTPLIRLGILTETIYGAGETLNGLSVWSLPGQPARPTAPLRAGFIRLLANPAFLRTLPKAAPIFGKFEAMQKRYAPGPHLYLQTISVDPAAQGQGLASRLIRPFLAYADARRLGTYTETVTPSNVGLYTHYGVKVVEEYKVPGTPLIQWGFYREPGPVS
jgi:ribosomal protein S18 acetylase RimI-like enzyme